MSGPFQVGVGDFMALATLARNVYRQCKQAPKQYQGTAELVARLRQVVEDLQDDVKLEHLDAAKLGQLREHTSACRRLLTELDQMLQNYARLGIKSKFTWDRLRWDQQRANDVRSELDSHVNLLNSFYLSIIRSSTHKVQAALDELLLEFRRRHADMDEVSSALTCNDQEQQQSAWTAISEDLAYFGIDDATVQKHRDLITHRILEAVQDEGFSDDIRPEDSRSEHGDAVPAAVADAGPDVGMGKSSKTVSRQATLDTDKTYAIQETAQGVILKGMSTAPLAFSHSPPAVRPSSAHSCLELHETRQISPFSLPSMSPTPAATFPIRFNSHDSSTSIDCPSELSSTALKEALVERLSAVRSISDSWIPLISKFLHSYAHHDHTPETLAKVLEQIVQLPDSDNNIDIGFCRLLLGIKYSLAGHFQDADACFRLNVTTVDLDALHNSTLRLAKDLCVLISSMIWFAETAVLLGHPLEAVLGWSWAILFIIEAEQDDPHPTDPWSVRSLANDLDWLCNNVESARRFYTRDMSFIEAQDQLPPGMHPLALSFLRNYKRIDEAVFEAASRASNGLKTSSCYSHTHWDHQTWDLFLARWQPTHSDEDCIIRWRGRGPSPRHTINLDERFLDRHSDAMDVLAFPYRRDPHFCAAEAVLLCKIHEPDDPAFPFLPRPAGVTQRFRLDFSTRVSFPDLARFHHPEVTFGLKNGVPYAVVTHFARSIYDRGAHVAVRCAFRLSAYTVPFSGLGFVLPAQPSWVSRSVTWHDCDSRPTIMDNVHIKQMRRQILSALEAAEAIAKAKLKRSVV